MSLEMVFGFINPNNQKCRRKTLEGKENLLNVKKCSMKFNEKKPTYKKRWLFIKIDKQKGFYLITNLSLHANICHLG